MNLWGRFAGLTFLAFIFLVACKEDETSLLGFKNSTSKYKVTYIEVPVPTSVMRLDSVVTHNNLNDSRSKRLLAGRYVDNAFGEITAEAYTQFAPIDPKVTIDPAAKLVSGFLVLSFDFYHYGDNISTTSTFTVHELLDSIPHITNAINELPKNIQRVPGYQPYYFSSSVPYDPTPLGTTLYDIDPSTFDKRLDDLKNNPGNLDHKTIDTLRIQLSPAYLSRLFTLAQSKSKDYETLTRFRRIFKGLVVRPGSTDTKIVGFNPNIDTAKFTKSRIILNYDEPDPVTGVDVRKTLEYPILNTGLIGFTKIDANRGGTPLSLLPSPGIEAELDGKRYYQSGNPVTTKLDFKKYLEFADTIPNLVLNSAQLSIDVEDAENFSPPTALRLRYLNSSNRFVNFYSAVSTEATFPLYPSMTKDEEGYYIIGQSLDSNVSGSFFDLLYNAETKKYTCDLTDFFQTLHDVTDEEFEYSDFAIVGSNPQLGKSVNRVIFNKDNIKLKIYYTVPAVTK